ncbi:MAG: hypothetical protein OXH68_20030 [Gammaproteobacteria bacterium]|nr:hypothetical protein [Gammaproteobacteria bacterium]
MATIIAMPLCGGGGPPYETPFVDHLRREQILAGEFPDPMPRRDLTALIAYIQLTGRFNRHHRELFEPRTTKSGPRTDFGTEFWNTVRKEGFERPELFRASRLTSDIVTITHGDGTSYSFTQSYFVGNCLDDAFKTAFETLLDRRERYGSGSAELFRWIEAQIAVFDQCSGEVAFEPPKDPDPGWLPLQTHDRLYQIAASYFYNGQYLEAAERFRGIGSDATSPWQDLGRYLVGRSLAREAVVNENNPKQHLKAALDHYSELASDPDYLASFPSLPGQIRYVDARLRPLGLRRELEHRLIHEPAGLSRGDVGSYSYLKRVHPVDAETTDYETWFRQATEPRPGATLQHWRDERSRPWLYLALSQANAQWDASILADLLDEADDIAPGTPGHFNMLLHRIRIHGLLGDEAIGLGLAENALRVTLRNSQVNQLRMAAARIASNWRDYFRWAPLKALSLSWPDERARRLPANFNRITRDTPLFAKETTVLVNDYFTPSMILEVIDAPALGNYLRGRMAISGWTKAMLAGDLNAALVLADRVRAAVPNLDSEFRAFQQADDKHFEAARIVFDHPAISPWIRPGEGRIQRHASATRPAPDRIAVGAPDTNWWCADRVDRDHDQRVDEMLRDSRFAHYSASEREDIRRVSWARTTAATTSFGPHVLRYAREHLDDPRIPRVLHRLVFATRHACHWQAPGSISRAAYVMLHEHFPESEWAQKTPYWYGRLE